MANQGQNPNQEAYVFRGKHARRVGDLLRRLLAAGDRSPTPGGEAAMPPGLPLLYGTTVSDHDGGDSNAILVNPCSRDGGDLDTDFTVTLYFTLPTDGSDPADLAGPLAVLSTGSVLAYLPFYDADNDEVRGLVVGQMLGTASSPESMDPASLEGAEAAQTDTWSRTSQGDKDGVDVKVTCRVAYNESGDEKLYGYYRTFGFDSAGRLQTISAETRYIIDTPDEC